MNVPQSQFQQTVKRGNPHHNGRKKEKKRRERKLPNRNPHHARVHLQQGGHPSPTTSHPNRTQAHGHNNCKKES